MEFETNQNINFDSFCYELSTYYSTHMILPFDIQLDTQVTEFKELDIEEDLRLKQQIVEYYLNLAEEALDFAVYEKGKSSKPEYLSPAKLGQVILASYTQSTFIELDYKLQHAIKILNTYIEDQLLSFKCNPLEIVCSMQQIGKLFSASTNGSYSQFFVRLIRIFRVVNINPFRINTKVEPFNFELDTIQLDTTNLVSNCLSS